MDLILFQPGDPTFIAGNAPNSATNLLLDTATGAAMPAPGSCIELISLHQGMKQQITTDVCNGTRSSSRPVITELTCVKYVDQNSVKLYDYCLRAQALGTGEKQASMLYMLRNSGDTTTNIITMALRDAIVSEIQFQSHPDDMPTEQFKLNFTEILWTYHTQTAADSEGKVSAGWSLARNQPIEKFTD